MWLGHILCAEPAAVQPAQGHREVKGMLGVEERGWKLTGNSLLRAVLAAGLLPGDDAVHAVRHTVAPAG
jgi:hypothetical protein